MFRSINTQPRSQKSHFTGSKQVRGKLMLDITQGLPSGCRNPRERLLKMSQCITDRLLKLGGNWVQHEVGRVTFTVCCSFQFYPQKAPLRPLLISSLQKFLRVCVFALSGGSVKSYKTGARFIIE